MAWRNFSSPPVHNIGSTSFPTFTKEWVLGGTFSALVTLVAMEGEVMCGQCDTNNFSLEGIYNQPLVGTLQRLLIPLICVRKQMASVILMEEPVSWHKLMDSILLKIIVVPLPE